MSTRSLQPRGFWADAWRRTLRRRMALVALAWIAVVGFVAIFAPLIANGHPIVLTRLDASGAVVSRSSPLFAHLTTTDLLLLIGAFVGIPWLALPRSVLGLSRSTRLALFVVAAIEAGVIAALASAVGAWFASPDRTAELAAAARESGFVWKVALGCAALVALVVTMIPFLRSRLARLGVAVLVGAVAATCVAERWADPLVDFERYAELEASGAARATYTLVPWSPQFGRSSLTLVEPGTKLGDKVASLRGTAPGEQRFIMGTDNVGRDVLSQMLYACRLSLSIGVVSTGIAVLIGVTLGALMGYFGGKVDLVLFRLVEIFMAIPVLFLLIVAAAVLPSNTYVMMAVIGCVTWTGAARFTRAEFLKLRDQDFVTSARAAGLPLRSILFRHMLPNGVTPVLVDSSFAIAAAIIFEATISFLGYGPLDQASWGRLLSSATTNAGLFVWWLAIFPGMAIFLTVLSYNVFGEALRDAIDPKLRKAAQ